MSCSPGRKRLFLGAPPFVFPTNVTSQSDTVVEIIVLEGGPAIASALASIVLVAAVFTSGVLGVAAFLLSRYLCLKVDLR